MKKKLILALVLLGITVLTNAQTTILEARSKAVGTVVTVTGIATNGSELGPIRYFQDKTAGIAAYGTIVNTVNRGDSVTITGTLKNYNQLLELDPTTSVVVVTPGKPLPAPIVLTPAQISEPYEGRLLKINDCIFKDAGLSFTGNKKYEFTASGATGYIYVKTGQNIVGTVIPNGMVNITAICSQFDFANPTAGYQLLPRDVNDIHLTSSIYLTGTLTNTAFTKTTLDFSWNTNITGTTEMFYGLSEGTIKSNKTSGTGGSTSHAIALTGITAGQVIWAQAFSVNGIDTAYSGVLPFATISNSTGNIKAYFNSPVDVSYSTGVNAIYLPQTMDDTLIKYINRAKYSIDLTMYNFNNQGMSNISTALKAAATRGLTVRVIGCGTTANLGIDELAGSAVNVLIGPNSANRTGIMHNKFILFDTESASPNDPLVWTGSTNLTDGQINLDANNVIIIQDQSLARGYKIEFEEMWGSNTATPNATNAKFGFYKKNNTPHEYVINGKRVESYFSPTDGVNAKIVQTINTADKDLSIATMLITRTEMADAIAARKTAGAAVNVITNAEGNNATLVNSILSASLGTHYTFDNVSSGIMHNKYMIVDQSATASDPQVFTGSHNWSAAADNDNDENTLIVHDAPLANIYYQNFVKRFVDNNGVLFELTGPPTAVNDTVKTAVDEIVTVEVLTNDKIQSSVTVSIETTSKHGTAYIPFSNPEAISYFPDPGFEGNDTITYKITYTAAQTLFATGKIFITVFNNVGLNQTVANTRLLAFPNPVRDGSMSVSCYLPSADKGTLQLFDVTGKLLFTRLVRLTNGENILKYNFPSSYKGAYFLRLTTTTKVWNQKVMFE